MTSTESATVLVVEDEVELADSYAEVINDAYTVHTTTTSAEGLEKADEDVDVDIDPEVPTQ